MGLIAVMGGLGMLPDATFGMGGGQDGGMVDGGCAGWLMGDGWVCGWVGEVILPCESVGPLTDRFPPPNGWKANKSKTRAKTGTPMAIARCFPERLANQAGLPGCAVLGCVGGWMGG